jgi:hypothetical protein
MPTREKAVFLRDDAAYRASVPVDSDLYTGERWCQRVTAHRVHCGNQRRPRTVNRIFLEATALFALLNHSLAPL